MFVLAPARSNSSVCCTMIGAHPELYGFPELILFTEELLGPTIERQWEEAGPGSRNAGLLRALAQLHDDEQSNTTVARALEWCQARREWTAGDVYDHLLDLVGPLIGVEKSPETSSSSETLARTARLYPEARFLHLTRHPILAQRSMHEHYEDRPWWPHGPDRPGPSQTARTWFVTHRRIKSFCERLPAEQTLRVRSEDILNDGGSSLRQIANWLRVSTDATAIEAMRRLEVSPYAGLGPETAVGGNDPKFLTDPAPRPTSDPPEIAFPAEWGVEPALQVNCAVLAAEFGYPAA